MHSFTSIMSSMVFCKQPLYELVQIKQFSTFFSFEPPFSDGGLEHRRLRSVLDHIEMHNCEQDVKLHASPSAAQMNT